jgi:hypothetical protein
MEYYEQKYHELMSLMTKDLKISADLLNISKELIIILQSDDDQKLSAAIQEREQYIHALVIFEHGINLITDEIGKYGKALPPEVPEMSRLIRHGLDEVSKLDEESMYLVCNKMQKYKNEAIKARNKKHISAYLRSCESV